MEINRTAGIVFDAVYYSVISCSKERFCSYVKIFAKNEDDILEHYHAFTKKYTIAPGDDLRLFFIFDTEYPNIIISYIDENFPDFNYAPQTVLNLLKSDTEKFRKFAYRQALKPFEKDVNIEAVIKEDASSKALAVALLASVHTDFPMPVHKFFYDFGAVVDQLISYLDEIFHKMGIFRDKRKSICETAVNDFINSDRVNEANKLIYEGDIKDFAKQSYIVSLFNRFVIKGSEKNRKVTLIIGDKRDSLPIAISIYKHITAVSLSSVFTLEINRAIINALKTGEKNITQLLHITKFSRTHISDHINMLKDELAIRVSRKDGNEAYYEINDDYFKAAKLVMGEELDSIVNRRK